MPYLDLENKFWDFKTGEVDGNVIFDTNTTGTPYFNDFLKNPDYMRKNKNLDSKIVYMTPTEYFDGCAKIFNSTRDRQISQTAADKGAYNHLSQVITKYGKKFPIGHLDFANMGQEGRHRMYVAGELIGWDVEQPVLVIDWYDEELHNRAEEQRRVEKIERKIDSAVKDSLRYRFDNIEDLRYQLQCAMNREFMADIGEDISFEFTTEDDKFVIEYQEVKYTFPYSDVKFEKSDEELFDEVDDDSEDISDWLKQYLGESIEKHDTLNPKLWKGMELRPNIKKALLRIVDRYIEDSEVLSENDIIDIELLGSNANYNYTDDSDLDVHIIVNMEDLSSDPAIVQIACNAEKALFNKAYDITVKGIDVEMYVEDVRTGANSNGVYSLMKDKWLKIPEKVVVPDMTGNKEFEALLSDWKGQAESLVNSNSSTDITNFVNELYNLRRISLMVDGEFSIGNLVFKEIRNIGLLQELKDRVKSLHSKELSLESLK